MEDAELTKLARQTLGHNMRRRRKELGMSQEELGDCAGLEQSYVSNVEAGTRNVSIDNIARIARGLNLGIEQLFLNKTD
jgi:XRE family transcriptional regulator, regulator of sulfur utilization